MTPKPTVQKRAIEPPEGWKQNTGLGYMRCGPGPGDELVSLADVLQWLGEVHNLPTVPALRLLVEGLKPEVFDALFEVQDDDFAKVVPSSFAFGYGTRGSAKNAGQGRNRDPFEDDESKSFWDFEEPVTSQEAEPVEPGLPALLRLISETGLTRLGSAAVTFEMAHRLWGWGGSVHELEDKHGQLLRLLDAYESRGKVLRAEFAKRQGLTEPNLKKQLGLAREYREQSKANPFSGLTVVNGKKVAQK